MRPKLPHEPPKSAKRALVPEEGSFGQWIQEKLPTKMNPACYVAGLLIEEGYAERARAGVIRFLPQRRT